MCVCVPLSLSLSLSLSLCLRLWFVCCVFVVCLACLRPFQVDALVGKGIDAEDGFDENYLASTIKRYPHEMRTLTPICLGHTKLQHKIGALIHQIKLEVSPCARALKKYCRQVFCICTDFGTESAIGKACSVDFDKLISDEAKAIGMDFTVYPALGGPVVPALTDELDGMLTEVVQESCCDFKAVLAEQRESFATGFSLTQRLFPNALYIPGTKHSMGNCLQDVWHSMPHMPDFLADLRSLEALLGSTTYRDKLVHIFFADMPDAAKQFGSWASNLKGLRWHQLIEFIADLNRVRGYLRKHFCLQRFVSELPSNLRIAEGKGFQGAKTLQAASSAIHSDYFWIFCDLMMAVSSVAERLSRWCEQCWFHGHACKLTNCPYKGNRAPELAGGAAQFLLDATQKFAQYTIVALSAGLGHDKATSLADNWQVALARLRLEVEIKTSFWQKLPYRLCAVSLPHPGMARVQAQECVNMWNALSPDEKRQAHPITRRFLDPTWQGCSASHSGMNLG